MAALVLGAIVLFFFLRSEDAPPSEDSASAKTNESSRTPPGDSPDNSSAAQPDAATQPNGGPTTPDGAKEDTQPPQNPEPVVEVKDAPAEKPAEKAEVPAKEKEPEETPQRKYAMMMLQGLGQWMNAADYVDVPFNIDGNKEVATISEVQELFDKASKEAIQSKAEFRMTEFASHDPETVFESGPEELRKYLANVRYAKMIDQAKKAGGHVGYMKFVRKVGEKDRAAELILAFNKEGKIVGFAD